MRRVRLVALSDDGTALVLALDDPDSGESERFELPVDDRLRAAARGDARRLGQIDVGSQLSPRAIQARIRSGHTPEQVAEDSGTPVERIMRFAHPVLQERSRIADQAREARVRLSEGTLTVNLHQFMSERVRMIGSESADVAYDAHRADDGAWLVTAAWQTGPKSGTTSWTFDLAGRTVAPADAATMDFAEGTRLVRVVPDVPHPPAEPAVRPPVAPLQEAAPAGSPPDPDDDGGAPAPAPAAAAAPGRPTPTATGIEESYLDEVAEHDTVVLGRTGEDDDDPRVRIPAWEDIVFGVRRHR
jgi:Protein of unknown function (DUF3071)